MGSYRMMLFKFGQQVTQNIAVNIAKYYELPASTIDEIERRNPGTTLIRALEQRMIICENEDKLREFHETLVMMEYLDLANIIEDVYPQFRQALPVSPQGANQPATPETSNSGRSSATASQGEITDEGRPLMSPTTTTPARQSNSPTRIGGITDYGRELMPPASMQYQSN
ncbi:hypothetical protein HOLleu_36835 [Holothuria leucospilota]|uniref:Uncharacterized protein n=1 Tax=Holothuria leucospilota TaxID=206669 RepID=A0A9Q1BGX0_HOLLE|nr:hypothetical protein HOLleu_36835 [Holothuria leucospilota]